MRFKKGSRKIFLGIVALIIIISGFCIWKCFNRPSEVERVFLQQKQKWVEILERQPDNTKALREVASASSSLGKHQQAIEYAKRATTIEEKNPRNWHLYGFILQSALEDVPKSQKRHVLEESKKVGLILLEFCRENGELQEENRYFFIQYLLGSAILLTTANEEMKAQEALVIAWDTAKALVESDSKEDREQGRRYLKDVQTIQDWLKD